MTKNSAVEHGTGTAGARLGMFLVTLVWVALIGLIAAIAGEYYLKSRWERLRGDLSERFFDRYKGFSTQYINPYYLFFFPFDTEERLALNNELATIDSAGFRGGGPELAGGRKLAFLLGGSTAFGSGTSDQTTLTGYLNQMQSEYYWVNAGVPSWNSTQELFRLVNQIMTYEPALVVAYDGANDIQIMISYHQMGIEYPAGTPESFYRLDRMLGDIRDGRLHIDRPPWYKRFFPHLTGAVTNRLRPAEEDAAGPVPDWRVNQTIEKYVHNLDMMHTVVTGKGGRFVNVFQPVYCLHENATRVEETCEYQETYAEFHASLFAKDVQFERYDFGRFFDAHFDTVPLTARWTDSDLDSTTIFVDDVHVFDRGSFLISKAIKDSLGIGP